MLKVAARKPTSLRLANAVGNFVKKAASLGESSLDMISQMLHGIGIFAYIWWICLMVNDGKCRWAMKKTLVV